MNRVVTRMGLTTLALVAGAAIYAQSPTTGVFTGKVTDSSGAALAGATVTLNGSGIPSKTVLTGSDGVYRFALVPAGSGFSLRVSKEGRASGEAKNLGLAPWQTYSQDFRLGETKVGEASAIVTVTANAAQVDTTTVTTSSTYTSESLKTIPLASRDYMSAALLTPGTADGGRGQGNPNIGGSTAFENNYIVDGLNVTDPKYGRNETRLNTLSVESIQVQTGGFEPEYGRSTGGIVSVVTKTGSNDFKADFEATSRPESGIAKVYQNGSQAFNGAKTAQKDVTTLAAWVGGPIIKDKLWYSIGVSNEKNTINRSFSAVYFLDPSLATLNPLARPLAGENATSNDIETKSTAVTAKFTFNLNSDNAIEFGLTRTNTDVDQPINGYTLSSTGNQHFTNKDKVTTWSGNWRSNLTSAWSLDVRVGAYKRENDNEKGSQFNLPFVAFSGASLATSGQLKADGTPLFAFNARSYPGLQIGGFGVDNSETLERKQFTIKGTNYIGTHILKYGVDYDETKYTSFFAYTGDFLITRAANANPLTGAFVSFTDTYRWRMGAGGVGVTRATGEAIASTSVLLGGKGLDLSSKSKNLAYFIQDSWQVTPKLLVVGGLRIDSQKLYGGDGEQYLEFKGKDMMAPRVGVTFDPWGDGKTKLQANFGRFYETVPMDLNQRAGSLEGFYFATRAYSGSAAASSIFYLPQSADIITSSGQLRAADASRGAGAVTHSRVIGGEKSAIQSDIKPQSIEEIGFGVERQLSDLWKAGAKWKYRYYKNLVEDYSFDFGSSYVIGNPGQRGVGLEPALVEEYDFPGQSEILYFPKPVRDYREMVLTLAKAKGGDKWSMDASLTFASNIGNFAGLDSPLNGQSDPNITSTYDLPTLMRNSYGNLPNTPKYNFQMSGSYDLGYGMILGGRFQYRAGVAISALGPDLGYLLGPYKDDPSYYGFQGQFLHYGNYGNNEALLEPRGSRGFTDDVTRTDIHFEWTPQFDAFKRIKLTAFLDVFNLFNQQMPLTVNQQKQFQTTVSGTAVNADGTPNTNVAGTRTGLIAVDNPNFLKPTSFQAPRSILIGLRISF